MRFLKEFIVLALIIIFLIASDFWISNFTRKSIEKINLEIDEIIKISLLQESFNKEEMLKKIESFESDWKDIESDLAYYSEHDELEKVSVAIVLMKSNIQMDDKENAYEKMQEIKYRIDHIKNKQQFKLNNMF